MRLGELEVIPISDGDIELPSAYFPNADWGPHRELLNENGNFDIQIGCFLVRTNGQNVLIDAGIGPVSGDSPMKFRGGDLPKGLAAAGAKPEDIDLVLLTHLHIDHIGWAAQDGAAFFPNATVRFGSQDLEQFVHTEKPDRFAAPIISVLEAAGRIDTIDDDGEVAPGVSTLHAPGHTHGHRCIVLSSGNERAFLLGDAVTCPVQLQETDWEAMSDVDPKLAKRTRESLWKELEGSEDLMVAAHFPGLQFGRVLKGEGKRYFA